MGLRFSKETGIMQGFVRASTVAVVATLISSTSALALEQVTFGTNWVAQAEHGGYYQALVDGSYEECGLSVTIVPGGPQVNNRALLPTGRIDFLMGGNMLQAFDAVKQGIPTIVVAADFQKEPQVLMTHPDQGLDTWESLLGIDLLIGRGGLASYYQWMKSEFGFTDEQVRPYTFNPAPFLANPRLGQQGYVTSEPFAIEEQGGFKPNVFLLADYGFNTYSTTIETRVDLVEKSPEIVQCFVDASAIGWYNFLYGDNKAALARIKEDNPEMTDAQLAFSIKAMKEYGIVDSGDSLVRGIGAMTDERQKSFFDKMVRAGVVDADLDYTKSYTLEFVNRGVGLDLRKKLTGE